MSTIKDDIIEFSSVDNCNNDTIHKLQLSKTDGFKSII